MQTDLQKVSDNAKKLKELNHTEFIKISSYMEGYLAAQNQKETKLT